MLPSTGLFRMSVVSHGKVHKEYFQREQTYIAVNLGDQFQLVLQNSSARRVVTIVGVDGLCIIEGQAYSDYGVGYVIEPGATINIESWRIHISHCSPLKFGQIPSGFEMFMDHPTQKGVIQATFFYEQLKPVYRENWLEQAAYGTKTSPPVGWGGTNTNQVMMQQFAKEDIPAATLSIRYLDQESLMKMGDMNSE